MVVVSGKVLRVGTTSMTTPTTTARGPRSRPSKLPRPGASGGPVTALHRPLVTALLSRAPTCPGPGVRSTTLLSLLTPGRTSRARARRRRQRRHSLKIFQTKCGDAWPSRPSVRMLSADQARTIATQWRPRFADEASFEQSWLRFFDMVGDPTAEKLHNWLAKDQAKDEIKHAGIVHEPTLPTQQSPAFAAALEAAVEALETQ